ncbi:murein transglycosylase A [Zeimonas arvi]|uniref:murein transglycosylase A n=1 Tax=Zeimonas arvi TaxID=2498847 RepID=UPI001CEDAC5E|nr:MltA domain-containing protein [Zeimonas arvi]
MAWLLAVAIGPLPGTALGQSTRAAPSAPTTAARNAPAGDASAAGPIAVDELPGWQRDGLDGLAGALARQCALRSPPQPWPALCPELPDVSASTDALRAWIERRFQAWPLAGENGDALGLITGYHEPVLTGSRERESPGQVPLYRRPADMLSEGNARWRIVDGVRRPYPARAEIERFGLLDGQELVWLDDPVEAFFLQIQGSGRVGLRDGTTLRVGFADHNGQAYRAIGAELIARGALAREQVDAPAIKAWLRANPAQATEVMRSNPRYIFFRELPTPADAGPPGSLGVPLTPMRSVATDPGFVPPGALLYLETRYPDDQRPLARAMLSQDRGAAIVGGVRADIFFGAGEQAERLAGLMKEPGRIWLLRPR